MSGAQLFEPADRRDVRGAARAPLRAASHGTSVPRGIPVPVMVSRLGDHLTPKDLSLHSRYRPYLFPFPSPWPHFLPCFHTREATSEGYVVLRGPRLWSGGDRRVGGGRLPSSRPRSRGAGRHLLLPLPGAPPPACALPASAVRFLPHLGVLSVTYPSACTPPSRPLSATSDSHRRWERGSQEDGYPGVGHYLPYCYFSGSRSEPRGRLGKGNVLRMSHH